MEDIYNSVMLKPPVFSSFAEFQFYLRKYFANPSSIKVFLDELHIEVALADVISHIYNGKFSMAYHILFDVDKIQLEDRLKILNIIREYVNMRVT